jgi:hypothetical protein
MCKVEMKGSECVGIHKYFMDESVHWKTPGKLAEFVSLGCVANSSLTQLRGNGRNVKSIYVHLPSLALDRLQSLVYVAFKWGLDLGDFKAQIDDRGLEFTTRGSFSPSPFRTFLQLSGEMGNSRGTKSPKRSQPVSPAKAAPLDRTKRGSVFSLPASAAIPMYDGRSTVMRLNSETPYETLPRLPPNEELQRGDCIWFGFHCNRYDKKDGSHNVSLNIMWIVLLHRGGEAAWKSITADTVQSEGGHDDL